MQQTRGTQRPRTGHPKTPSFFGLTIPMFPNGEGYLLPLARQEKTWGVVSASSVTVTTPLMVSVLSHMDLSRLEQPNSLRLQQCRGQTASWTR